MVEAGPFVPEEKPGAKKVKEESAPFTAIHNQSSSPMTRDGHKTVDEVILGLQSANLCEGCPETRHFHFNRAACLWEESGDEK